MANEKYKATIEDLAAWMSGNTSLSDNSIKKYSRAVSTISDEMFHAGVIPVSLFEMSVLQLIAYLPEILNNDSFVKKNTTGNSMYSNALEHYRLFRTVENDAEISRD